MSDYKVEFPDFESAIPPVFLAAPWSDASWHNDATPSFMRQMGQREIHVFVDEEDPAKRWEGGPDCPRFSVHTTDEDGSFDGDGPCFASDSLAAVLDHVGFLVGEVSR